jgi:glycosyltransferase involved in cell wall biosynthesis
MAESLKIDVSVIIPTFHREKLLLDSIHSVLAQPNVSVEVIVLDDSEEGSAQPYIEELVDPRVCYFKRAVPSGGRPGIVRNEGWSKAQGRYLYFLDDDDKLVPEVLHSMVQVLDHNKQHGMVFGRVVPGGSNREVLEHETKFFECSAKRAQSIRTRFAMVAYLLFKEAILISSACLVRKECIEYLGGYDQNIALCEGIDLQIRVVREFGGRFIDQPVVIYNTGAPSLIHDLTDDELLVSSYKHMYDKYKAEHGLIEFMMLKVFAKLF